MSIELYKQLRPKSLNQMIGQQAAVNQIRGMKGRLPHALLFTGPSGTGKTTLIRILKRLLKCSDSDFTELNAGQDSGIDTIRHLENHSRIRPINGPCRIFALDECHSLTTQAQQAFLKLLEDTPEHCYFMLATTDPQKLARTVRTRCTEIVTQPLSNKSILLLLKTTLLEINITIDNQHIQKIIDVAEGSARKALVLLDQIRGVEDEKEVDEILQKGDAERQAIELCRLLIQASPKWTQAAAILKNLKDDPERTRRLVLSYMSTVALNGRNQKAIRIMKNFETNYFDSGFAGLILSVSDSLA